MTRVAVFTGTRAEYGLLYWLMRALAESPSHRLQVIAAAMHMSPEFGETWRQIEGDGFAIDAKVEMLLSSDTAVGVAKSMGLGTIGFADALDRLRPDWLVVLGDRFEALAIAQAALVMRIPIAHLHGGELTEGAYDDAIRHAITKMASLHLTAAEPYRQRVIQMGEQPGTVFNVGAPGLEQLKRVSPVPLDALAAFIGMELGDRVAIATYHPVTSGAEDPVITVKAMLTALDAFPEYQVVATYPNADNGGRAIIPILEDYARSRPGRAVVVPSLGLARYASLLKRADFVIGNSSSGIIEAPGVGVPTINIGVRQGGRLAAASVIHCDADPEAIRQAIARAIEPTCKAMARTAQNPYGAGDTSRMVVAALDAAVPAGSKRFFDIESIS